MPRTRFSAVDHTLFKYLPIDKVNSKVALGKSSQKVFQLPLKNVFVLAGVNLLLDPGRSYPAPHVF